MPKVHMLKTVKLFKPSKVKLAYLLIACGLILAIIAIVLSIHHNRTEPKPPPGALTSKSAPTSVKPTRQATVSYSVPALNPKYIAIPAIGISNTDVLKLGLLSNGAINVPDNIYQTGWYDGSSLPGHSGAMFIYGHVSSWTADGIFYNLKKLVPGDIMTITTGNNTVYTYRVIKSAVYPYTSVPMNTVLAPVSDSTPGLNLMTCTGTVIKGTSEFNERLVVYTSLVKS
ncbi:MAG TPA: class F sortase [Candidatus Saccharimonadales bacterium]|jgi:LPXTG-site transpeptidase (sortase) family protein|nr:class F sortase [Candidatus Saccharimonadales bacterium]